LLNSNHKFICLGLAFLLVTISLPAQRKYGGQYVDVAWQEQVSEYASSGWRFPVGIILIDLPGLNQELRQLGQPELPAPTAYLGLQIFKAPRKGRRGTGLSASYFRNSHQYGANQAKISGYHLLWDTYQHLGHHSLGHSSLILGLGWGRTSLQLQDNTAQPSSPTVLTPRRSTLSDRGLLLHTGLALARPIAVKKGKHERFTGYSLGLRAGCIFTPFWQGLDLDRATPQQRVKLGRAMPYICFELAWGRITRKKEVIFEQ
jgi:hypothetical protein